VHKGGLKSDRKRVHHKRTNSRKILSPHEKNEKKYFKGFTVEHIDRNKKIKIDELAKAAAQKTPLAIDVFF
jgi:hypothetical protein